jgi:hypothetical protein
VNKEYFRQLVNLNVEGLSKICNERLASEEMRPLGFQHVRLSVPAPGHQNQVHPAKRNNHFF